MRDSDNKLKEAIAAIVICMSPFLGMLGDLWISGGGIW